MKVKIFSRLHVACEMGFILMLISTTPLFSGLGKIAGTVTDAQSGEALAGANVSIVGTAMGASTDENGHYFILNIPPGKYVVTISAIGYAIQETANVRAQLGVTTKLDAKLKPTVIEGETASIVAERSVVGEKMTGTRVSFQEEQLDNTLPAIALDDILLSSIAIQAMRGANKAGIKYLIDGVNVTDIMWPTGGGSQGYTLAKHDDTPTSLLAGSFIDQSSLSLDGRIPGMVKTVGSVYQGMIQEAEVIVGTANAEYSASGGVVNLASKSGGEITYGKVFIRSSLGGLNHVGPDVYNGGTSYSGGKSARQCYEEYRDQLANDRDQIMREYARYLSWTPNKYEYGEKPRVTAEVNIGGPLTSKSNFFWSGSLLNDHGRFPGEFQRLITASLKLNYHITPSDRISGMVKIDDGGKLLGWKNRQYTYPYQFFLEGQPVNEKLGIMSYLKWNKIFDPSSFVETTLSYVANYRTYGYCPVDGKLQYDYYGDFLILDTKEKVEKYIHNPETRIFYRDINHFFLSFANLPFPFVNQFRFVAFGYLYEDFKTNALTIKSDYTRQLDFHHQLKLGGEYVYNTIDNFLLGSNGIAYDSNFPFTAMIYKVHPWSFGMYIQDRIEYGGVIANIGLRLDGYNKGSRLPENLFDPISLDTLDNGQRIVGCELGPAAETHIYLSPRLGISHPISENAAMHYSWGIHTTTPNLGYWLFNSGGFGSPSPLRYRDPDPEPERATACEIGVELALTNEAGFDLTAYYRDTRNSGVESYEVNLASDSVFSSMTYFISWGYRISRGIELNFWKRPSERYFGIVGISGNLGASLSYDASSLNASSLAVNTPQSLLPVNTQDEDTYFDALYTCPTTIRTYNDWNIRLLLLMEFPMDVKLSTITAYRSPWRYKKTINVTNTRYEEMLDGDDFFRIDLRLIKYFRFGGSRVGIFVEALNVLNTENILRFDLSNNNTGYEEGKGPWGSLNRPVDQWGNPYADIARELYAGLDLTF
ncbi:TonB-dependent receptor [candidate division KSB1 bacterium]|nr:TonB-dependent receptor [candidate division KSB1 bacterium]